MPRTKTSDLEIKEISEIIRKALKNSHLTQKELSEKTGIRLDTLKSYIKAHRCPSLENAQKIGEITGTNYMYFLSTEQRKRLRNENRGTFIEKNKVYVSLIRSAGFKFDAVSDDNLEIKCKVSAKTFQPYNQEHAEILQQIEEYRRGLREFGGDYLEDLFDGDAYYTKKATPRLDLNSDTWEILKKEILNSVRETIYKNMAAAAAAREKEEEEKTRRMITADLLETVKAVQAVLPKLDSSGAVDRETLETLRKISRKYF